MLGLLNLLAGSALADDIITIEKIVTGVSISNENGLIDNRVAAGVT